MFVVVVIGISCQKGSGVGRGVKEKDSNWTKRNTTSGIGLSLESDDTMNADTPVGVASAVKEGVTSSVVDKTVEMEKIISLEDTAILESFPPLSTSHPDENLLKEDVSTVSVWVKLHGVPVTAFSKDALCAITTKLVNPLMLNTYTSDMCMQSWGMSSHARVMIELRADVELKDNIIMTMPKITRECHYICNVRVEYEWKPPRCSSCKVFGHIHEEYPKNTGAEYRLVPKKPNASSSGNKNKSVEPTIEVSNSNPFDVCNSIDNDVEFSTNRGTTNLVNNVATSSGSSFINIDNDGEFDSNTYIGITKSDSEVEVVFDETSNLRISTSGKDRSDKSYGTNSLLDQWMDSYQDNDDYDPYNDDMVSARSIMNEVDIENLTIEQYLMLTQENQTQRIAKTGSDEEVSSDEDVDELLNAEIGKRMTGQDKEEEEDSLIDILKTASVNVISKSLFEHLKLADLKETNMMVGMVNMTKKAPLGIMENILVKINKFLFHSDFVVIDMLEGPNKTMFLGKPFLAMIHAQIDVFRREISLGIGSHPLENVVSRWHVCKPVRVIVRDCEKDYEKWPTCNPDLSFCSGYDAIYGKEESGML
nr:hypothetical protein [Tanacetum cinerariifolium]